LTPDSNSFLPAAVLSIWEGSAAGPTRHDSATPRARTSEKRSGNSRGMGADAAGSAAAAVELLLLLFLEGEEREREEEEGEPLCSGTS
jgi:hypothetical protein